VATVAADPRGFLDHRRRDAVVRPVDVRLGDWQAVTEPPSDDVVRCNARRCMDCGVAFCEFGCPLGNRVPDFSALIADGRWQAASDDLHAVNNFPEFTGSLCPAPCEESCVLAINDEAVAVRQIELAIVERAFEEGWVVSHRPQQRTDRSVVVLGSGPAGLAAAQQLTRAGHDVTVLERDDRLGGLLRYGIPDFKIDKSLIDRRLEQLHAEGTTFVTGVDVGRDIDIDELRTAFDAVVVACGAGCARQLDVPGSALSGVHGGIEYLVGVNRLQSGDLDAAPIDAAGRNVTVIGGGDTGLDCVATANRQGAESVRILDHNPCPPPCRDEAVNPWPQWPRVHSTGYAHEEGVDEMWRAEVRELVDAGDGQVCAVRGEPVDAVFVDGIRHFERDAGEPYFSLESDLVLLAMGFDGVERGPLVARLELTPDGTIAVDDGWATSTSNVFACGDATRGASLVGWAIADGRSCAAAVHASLTGECCLPSPVAPGDRPL
jgi:glutamate synthase (NADPH/NADH) small chain